MKVSSLRLVCIGLFLFVVTSVRVEAADSLSDPPDRYLYQCRQDSAPQVTFRFLSYTRASAVVGFELVALRDVGQPSLAPWNISVSTTEPFSLDGSEITVTMTDKTSAPRTLYCKIIKHYESPEVGTVSDYSIQDILVCGFAFLSMCFGWGVGARVA